jgi:non-ribosomal peptide synthetase component F
MKAGGAFLPLDTSHPIAQTEQILGETRSSLVLTSRSNQKDFAHLAPNVWSVDEKAVETNVQDLHFQKSTPTTQHG